MDYINIPISKIGRVVTGKTPSTAMLEYYDGDIMFITPSELHTDFIVKKSEKTITTAGFNSIKNNTIRGTSVMVGCIGWDMGNVAVCTETCATNQQINSITDIRSEYNPLYIYYWLKTKKDYLFSLASVTRTPILSKSTFEEIFVPMPQKDKQDAITHILSTVDKKIMSNNAVNDNLAQMINLIYEQWFYRFEFPNVHNLPYSQSNGEMIWNEKFKRYIPQGWKVQSMLSNDLFSVVSSGIERFASKKYYATADIIGSDIGEGNDIDYETRESRANMQPVLNSVWFAKMKNSVKHLFLNKEMLPFIESSILSTGFYGLKCSELSFEYIASVVSAPIFESTKDRLSHGATQQGIGDDDMANIALLIPDNATLTKFHEATKGLYSQISNNILENKRLIAIRNFLLPLLMNGQATISE